MGILDGQVALVTGAASGIGAAVSRCFASEGARVLVADITDGTGVASEIGEAACAVKLDVRSSEEWAVAVMHARACFGKLTILVNNAGVVAYGKVAEIPADEVRRVIDINLIGAIFGTQAAVPALLDAGGGTIVNVSSVDGLIAHNGLSAYVASKWGLRGYTKACALELSHQGIRVNSVHPGGVFTPLANPLGLDKATFDARTMRAFPTQRAATPEEIAQAILFLAGPQGSYCSGAELAVDGGMTAGQYMPFLPGTPTQ